LIELGGYPHFAFSETPAKLSLYNHSHLEFP
jgi:hypothetical protein